MKKVIRKILIILFIIILVIFVAFNIYTSGYYHAIDCNDYLNSNDNVTVSYDNDNNIWFKPKEEKDDAIIFYPGGLVEHRAYAPIMRKLADKGYLTVICNMPYNLAFFNSNAASQIISSTEFKDKDTFIAGHSLGGAFASRFYQKNNDKLKGLILMAAYSDKDLSKIENAHVLQIYGTLDNVINKSKLEKYKTNLPSNLTLFEINGGNHSYFGSYGVQKKDNEATITALQQWEITTLKIDEFIQNC